MNKEKLKINNIVSALLSMMLKKNATKVYINVENYDELIRIKVTGNMEDFNKEKLEDIRKTLEADRTSEIEEPYWELSDDLDENNLYLLGAMIDKFHLDFDGEFVEMTLVREKNDIVGVD